MGLESDHVHRLTSVWNSAGIVVVEFHMLQLLRDGRIAASLEIYTRVSTVISWYYVHASRVHVNGTICTT